MSYYDFSGKALVSCQKSQEPYKKQLAILLRKNLAVLLGPFSLNSRRTFIIKKFFMLKICTAVLEVIVTIKLNSYDDIKSDLFMYNYNI